MKTDLDWLNLCPDNFRDRIQLVLSNLPGEKGSEGVYNQQFSDEIIFLSREELYAMYGRRNWDEIKEKLKKYAEAWGEFGEALTMKHLISRGLPIREWRWSPPHGKGEIDIITQQGNRIIFVEVKSRTDMDEDPLKSIDRKKIRNLCHGADIYLKMQSKEYEYQFDVAMIKGNYRDYEFEYIEDAFLCPLSSFRK